MADADPPIAQPQPIAPTPERHDPEDYAARISAEGRLPISQPVPKPIQRDPTDKEKAHKMLLDVGELLGLFPPQSTKKDGPTMTPEQLSAVLVRRTLDENMRKMVEDDAKAFTTKRPAKK
jgi:hypothetical protein